MTSQHTAASVQSLTFVFPGTDDYLVWFYTAGIGQGGTGGNDEADLKLQINGLDVADIHAATSSGTVRCTVCAIIDDV